MNGKCLGMKIKHMGMKWMWIDDQFSILESELSEKSFDYNKGSPTVYKENHHHIDTLTNITFDIPEDPEYKEFVLEKLEIDKFPGKIPTKKHKSVVPAFRLPKINPKRKYTSPWYVNPKKWNKISNSLTHEKMDPKKKMENLYFFLHKNDEYSYDYEGPNELDIRYNKLKSQIKTLDTPLKFQRYLESKNLRIPSCIQEVTKSL